MTVGYFMIARNAMADAVCGLLDGTLPGKLTFYDMSDVAVATITLAAPTAFMPASNGIALANTMVPEFNAPGGTIAYAVFENGDTDEGIMDCSVTGPGGGGDIELSSVIVTVGQKVVMENNLFYEAPQ
jgi:hypothetical protein